MKLDYETGAVYYYASIMLDAFLCPVCMNLCWYNQYKPTVSHNRHLLVATKTSTG